MNEPLHVYPVNDTKEHRFDEFCECEPEYKDGIWAHNSYDGREYIDKLTENNNINLN